MPRVIVAVFVLYLILSLLGCFDRGYAVRQAAAGSHIARGEEVKGNVQEDRVGRGARPGDRSGLGGEGLAERLAAK